MFDKLTGSTPRLNDGGILVVRAMMGVIFINAGLGDFEMGLSNAAAMHGQNGIPLSDISAPYTAFTQVVGGALLIFGVLVRAFAVALTVVMAGAVVFVHLDQGLDGMAYPLMMAAALIAVFLTGPGRYSVDALLAERRSRPSRPGMHASRV